MNVHIDPSGGDQWLRAAIYAGDIVVVSPRSSTARLGASARQMLEAAFDPLHPVDAQHHLTVEDFVDVFAPVKPTFIHDPSTLPHIASVFRDLGMDVGQWYLDVPRLRGATSDGYLTSGVGFAFPPHRDTWYGAPPQQINWWMPLYPFDEASGLAIHPRYFGVPVENDSEGFDYYEWNAVGRRAAASMIARDTRHQPSASGKLDLGAAIRLVVPVGALIAFSGDQLHATVANTSGRTRFSIDFRTVDIGDVRAGVGAPMVDARCRGTSLRDFRRASDLATMPDDVVARYERGPVPDGAVLVYDPKA